MSPLRCLGRLLLRVLPVLCLPADAAAQSTTPPEWRPARLSDGWEVATPAEASVDRCLLDSMTAAIRDGRAFPNVHAVLIARDDRLIYEQYFSGRDRRYRGEARETVEVTFGPDSLHVTRSVGKGVTSALVGIALGSGAISSLDTPLVDFFPEYDSLVTPEKERITLRHALTMSAGLDWNEGDVPYTDPANHAERMHESRDPAGFVLARDVVQEPGSQWYYNSGLPTLLGFVAARATGRSFGTFAREALFGPLGIAEVEWAGPESWSEIPELRWESAEPWADAAVPGGSLWIRPRDLAKFGSLYLNEGRWNGRQVVPADWIEESTRRHIEVEFEGTEELGEFGYGYLWWHALFRTSEGDLEVHTAVGNGDQRIWVVPALDLLVVHLAGRYNEGTGLMSERLLLDYIVPAVQKAAQRKGDGCPT